MAYIYAIIAHKCNFFHTVCLIYLYLSVLHKFAELATTEATEHAHIQHIFIIHLSVDEHLDCCHLLTIVNNAAVNLGVHISL